MYVEYMKAKGGNNTSKNGVYSYKFYEDFNQWWHQFAIAKKHVTTSTNDVEVGFGIEKAENIMTLPKSSSKLGIPSTKDSSMAKPSCYSPNWLTIIYA